MLVFDITINLTLAADLIWPLELGGRFEAASWCWRSCKLQVYEFRRYLERWFLDYLQPVFFGLHITLQDFFCSSSTSPIPGTVVFGLPTTSVFWLTHNPSGFFSSSKQFLDLGGRFDMASWPWWPIWCGLLIFQVFETLGLEGRRCLELRFLDYR